MKGMERAPDFNLKLTYVNGFRTFDSWNMAKLLPNGDEVIFCSAAVGVTMKIKPNL